MLCKLPVNYLCWGMHSQMYTECVPCCDTCAVRRAVHCMASPLIPTLLSLHIQPSFSFLFEINWTLSHISEFWIIDHTGRAAFSALQIELSGLQWYCCCQRTTRLPGMQLENKQLQQCKRMNYTNVNWSFWALSLSLPSFLPSYALACSPWFVSLGEKGR